MAQLGTAPVVVQAMPVQQVQQPRAAIMPMQRGFCINRYFDPVFSTTLPLDWKEFEKAVAEVDGVMRTALPAWLSCLPAVFPFLGIILFLAGMVMFISQGMSEQGMSEGTGMPTVPIAVALSGMFLMIAGGMGSVCYMSARRNQAISDVRRKLSELNARYADRGVDFQLHESKHLEFHHGSSSSRGRVHTVTDYTLVVQAVAASCAPSIAGPEVLRGAFEQGFSNNIV